jgi:hypothetical protein
MAPPVRSDTPRIKFQFRLLGRSMRRAALKTLFDELQAQSLGDRRSVICRIEQIVFLYRAHPKIHFETVPSASERAKWVRAVNRHSTKLAALLRRSPYGDNYLSTCFLLPNIADDLDRLAKGHKATAAPPSKPAQRPRQGFDWLVANLADFYVERTHRPIGCSRNNDDEASGPLVRLVRSVCDLIGGKSAEKTNEAIRQTIRRLPDKSPT